MNRRVAETKRSNQGKPPNGHCTLDDLLLDLVILLGSWG